MNRILFLILALFAAPAFAEPVSAGMAIYGMYAGGTAFAAGVAAMTTAEMVIAGAMIAGSAMSLVGNVTGNKNLMKYGSLLTLAGGVGNLAAGAKEAAASSVLEEGGGSQLGAGGALGAGPNAGAVTSPVVAGGDVAQAELPGIVGGAEPAITAPVETNKGLIDSATTPTQTNALPGTEIQAEGGYGETGGMAEPTGQATQATQAAGVQNPLRAQEAAAGVVNPGTAPAETGVKDYLRMGSDFLKSNKEIANVGGKLIEGAFTAKNKQEQQREIWDEENRRRQSYSDSVAKSVVPYGVTRRPTPAPAPTQNPVRFVPQRTGA